MALAGRPQLAGAAGPCRPTSRPRPSCRAAGGQQGRSLALHIVRAGPEVIASSMSSYNNNITVLEIPANAMDMPPEFRGARLLILDTTGNVHSVWRPDSPLTGQYWDVLAMAPAVIPEGPISILGLGAGTIARAVHHYFPQRRMEGWELDPAVDMIADQYLGLEQLKKDGCLVGRIGDALDPSAAIPGGSAGIIVDLFSCGELLPALAMVETWRSIRQRLQPGGRVIANLGAVALPGWMGPAPPGVLSTMMALDAVMKAFEGEVQYTELVRKQSCNMVILTGAPLAEGQWSSSLPAELPEELRGLVWKTRSS